MFFHWESHAAGAAIAALAVFVWPWGKIGRCRPLYGVAVALLWPAAAGWYGGKWWRARAARRATQGQAGAGTVRLK